MHVHVQMGLAYQIWLFRESGGGFSLETYENLELEHDWTKYMFHASIDQKIHEEVYNIKSIIWYEVLSSNLVQRPRFVPRA